MLLEVEYSNENHGVKSAKFAFNPLGIVEKGNDIAIIIDASVYQTLSQDPNARGGNYNPLVGTVEHFYQISYEDFMRYAEQELKLPNNLRRVVRLHGQQFPTRN